MFLYWQRKPHVDLQPYVKSYWHFRRTFAKSTRHTIYPDSYFELIWVKEGALYINGVKTPEYFFSGFNEAPLTLSGEGRIEVYAVRFYAWGCVPFTNIELSERHSIASVSDFLGAAHFAAFKRKTRHEKVNFYKAADDLLISILAKEQSGNTSKTRLPQDIGPESFGSMHELITASGLSNRQLERRIRKATGSTPKEVTKRTRFEKIRKALIEGRYDNISELAREYGYVDQSHLNKEFRSFTGMTPVQFRDKFCEMHAHLKRSGRWPWD